ncbi:hypothetical protein LTR62_007128 [Meristemomyces frigidus]|uniref:Fibronectin type-III domain-containing protein n=1 Tax=Meristemomyces frigidus TaxID=1508187 RepID=A0AAN7TBX0_9PEZI|nr:hypothetical protein LTR62_007128 [Meristemomyces frigidus]
MASDVSSTFVLPPGVVAWVSRLFYFVHFVSSPLAFWFRPCCVALAAGWLAYRAWQVLNKPLEDLASLLGFDIPLTPSIDLASIKADGCILRWNLPERQRQKSKLKYEVQVNGAIVDHVSIHETAVTIVNLYPGTYYVVRVALVNEQDLASRSEAVRFKTKSASSRDFFVPQHSSDAGDEPEQDGNQSVAERLPRVRVFRGLKDIALAPASFDTSSAPMERQGSNNGLGPRKSVTGRRPSPAALDSGEVDSLSKGVEPPHGQESIQQLTTKLENLREETAAVEQSVDKEDEEDNELKQTLVDERDALKAQMAEKNDASRNLRKELALITQQNATAQGEKNKQERLLHNKQQEREKQQADILKWQQQSAHLKEEAARIETSQAEYMRQIEEEKTTLRLQQADEYAAMRSLDDEIKDTNASIKKLERGARNATPDGTSDHEEPNLVIRMQQDAEDERKWQIYKTNLAQQYASTFQKLEASKRFCEEQNRYLETVCQQRRREDEYIDAQSQFSSPPAPTERPMHRGDSQRSRRATNGQSNNNSPRMGHFPLAAAGSLQSPLATGVPGISSANNFPTATYFNPHNGMTLRADISADYGGMTDEDRERLTGGALMSPGAGADLLPADLFSGDDGGREQGFLPGLGTLPGLPALGGRPSLSQPTTLGAERDREHSGPGPASPGSVSSRSPSVFASPRASQNNLNLGSVEPFPMMMDSDRRSVRSTRSNRAGTAGALGTSAASSRFSGLFGIKQRTKTTSAGSSETEGLALGKALSHSMPRQDQSISNLLDSQMRKRNSSISGLSGSNINLGGLDGASDSVTDPPTQSQVSRFRAFGMGRIFGNDKESTSATTGGWPSGFTRRPGSPRPGSTHSNELPRPSVDSSRWGVDPRPSADAVAGARSSPLSFNTSWMLPSTTSGGSRLYGSRHPSRRPSVQYANSGPPEDIMEDDDSDELDQEDAIGSPVTPLAPIGTKPSGKQRAERDETLSSPAARLNPAAKDFKSFLGIKSKDKGRTASSAGLAGVSNGVSVPSNSLTGLSSADYDTGSPPESRKSRSDARSMTTTESSLADSSEHTIDLARTTSYTNSDATGPSPLIGSSSKESFMQKITRKSSSGKFTLPTFKRVEKSRLAESPASSSTLNMPEAEDQDDLGASVGSLREGRESKEAVRTSGSVRGWSSVLKSMGKGKEKKGGETPSVSGLSMASGTEDGEDGGTEEEG